ncbi:MAG TPA: hypothetical protein VE820_06955, partial [Sphingomicrobium sp.]|nr:hypothetical protein [Sphingomicrobium sp.]
GQGLDDALEAWFPGGAKSGLAGRRERLLKAVASLFAMIMVTAAAPCPQPALQAATDHRAMVDGIRGVRAAPGQPTGAATEGS